jgi:hypothetical protein
LNERIEAARRRYFAAFRTLVDRYGAIVEIAWMGASGPGVLSASTPEQFEVQAQRAESLVGHCDRVEAINLRRHDLNELVDGDERLPMLTPWALHPFGLEIDAAEALTEERWNEARKEMERIEIEGERRNSQVANSRR